MEGTVGAAEVGGDWLQPIADKAHMAANHKDMRLVDLIYLVPFRSTRLPTRPACSLTRIALDWFCPVNTLQTACGVAGQGALLSVHRALPVLMPPSLGELICNPPANGAIPTDSKKLRKIQDGQGAWAE